MNIVSKSKERDDIKKIRLSLDINFVRDNSLLIQKNFLDNLDYFLGFLDSSKPIFSLYNSAFNEVDSLLIANFLAEKNYILSYPVFDQESMKFGIYQSHTKNLYNKYFNKILEPQTSQFIEPDIVITPLIAFDRNLNRIGMGKGFYDKAIASLRIKKKIIVVGLAYDFQLLNGIIEVNDFDQKLDFVVTKDKIYQADLF